MAWLNRLPGFTRSASGLEWSIWKLLPAIVLWGTAVPLAVAAAAWFAAPGLPTSAEDRGRLLMIYQIVGLVVLHWTLVLTLAIGSIPGAATAGKRASTSWLCLQRVQRCIECLRLCLLTRRLTPAERVGR